MIIIIIVGLIIIMIIIIIMGLIIMMMSIMTDSIPVPNIFGNDDDLEENLTEQKLKLMGPWKC